MGQNNTVQQFTLHGENGINDEWSDDSSDSEECRLAVSLEVDQRGPYVQGKVMGHKVSFLVDTGATRSTVRSAEVPKLPLSGRTIKVVGVANQLLTNPITVPVQVEIGTFQGLHRFVVCDSSPMSLLGKDLLCKTRCSITCSNEGIEVQTNTDDEGDDCQISEPETETADEEYPFISFILMFTMTDLPADLLGTVTEKVWDLTRKEVGLIRGVEPVKVDVKPNAVFPQMRLVDENEANNATVSETATLTPWEKLEQDTKYLHDETNAEGELSTNVFYRLLGDKRIKEKLAKHNARKEEKKREKMFREKYEKAKQKEEIEMKEIKK
ncbi:hypothetical protein NDU88_007590 [Pleurodeles waltl]|uniref:Peptidase A2 domain-containing protein n=1 Tax=Pleurodeles waltl TaxID=8319 RepID=A0AAV7QL91_PLEWA|nr:hypothetical protein NDU88_007590 [Pleurodeles waltl]